MGCGNGNGPPAAAFDCNLREGAVEKLMQICNARLGSKLSGDACDMLTSDPNLLRAASKGPNEQHDNFFVGSFSCHYLTNEPVKLEIFIVGKQIID